MTGLSFHDASIFSITCLNDSLEIVCDGVTGTDGAVGRAMILFRGVRNLQIDDKNASELRMHFPDGEVIFLDVSENEAHIGIEWNDFSSKRSEFHSYKLQFQDMEIRH